jgi:hypothetical protein
MEAAASPDNRTLEDGERSRAFFCAMNKCSLLQLKESLLLAFVIHHNTHFKIKYNLPVKRSSNTQGLRFSRRWSNAVFWQA